MKSAEENFFNTLSGGLIKESDLSPGAIQALGVDQPELLDQLEQQAGGMVDVVREDSDQPEEVGPTKEPREPKPKIVVQVPKNFFRINEMHPLKLLTVLKIKYDDAWVEWVPETLWEMISRDFGPVSEVNQNKIQALAVALKTDAPWQDWTTFENCGRAFNDTIPVFGQIQPLSPAETAFAIFILERLHDFKFSDEVLGYVASVCLYNGIVLAPEKWFNKAQSLVDKQNKNVGLKTEVSSAWKSVQKEDLTVVELDGDKPLDVHIAKLWAIQEYLRDKNSQLKEA